MKVKIEIDCDNDAFETPDFEIERILRELSEKVESNPGMKVSEIYDINGNCVGLYKVFGKRSK